MRNKKRKQTKRRPKTEEQMGSERQDWKTDKEEDEEDKGVKTKKE